MLEQTSLVFQKSTLNEALMSNLLNFSEGGVIVVDEAFPLRTDILKPFNSRREFGVKQKADRFPACLYLCLIAT